jgi:hypothetical protein
LENEILSVRLCELEKRFSIHMEAMKEARELAKQGIEARLEKMNEFRTQLDRQAATFALSKDVEARFRPLEKWKDTMDGRIWALGLGLGILEVVLKIFWK